MNSKNYAAYAAMVSYQKTREFQEEYRRKHDANRSSIVQPIPENYCVGGEVIAPAANA